MATSAIVSPRSKKLNKSNQEKPKTILKCVLLAGVPRPARFLDNVVAVEVYL